MLLFDACGLILAVRHVQQEYRHGSVHLSLWAHDFITI